MNSCSWSKMIKGIVIVLFSAYCWAVKFEEGGKSQETSLNIEVNPEDFLKSYNYYPKYVKPNKLIKQTTLAYVTPWNSRGYDIAKIFSEKFSLIAPVWLQLKPTSFKIEGLHDVDENWMQAVRNENPKIKFVPRIIFDGWSEKDFQETFDNGRKEMECINSIIDLFKKYKFDGLVVEIWMQHSGTHQRLLVDFVVHLAKMIHFEDKLIILPIPPPVYAGGIVSRFGQGFFDMLVSHVDYFSLMTYDYSNSLGPNSPLEWLRDCVQHLVPDQRDKEKQFLHRSKLLVGLNFYGLHFHDRGGKHVVGRDVVKDVVENRVAFTWHKQWAEHSYKFTDSTGQSNVVFYPSQLSVARRVELIGELGTGLAIWEIGQGLDSFYSLL